MPKSMPKSHAAAPDRSREKWDQILAGPKRNSSRHPERSYCIRNTPLVPRARWRIDGRDPNAVKLYWVGFVQALGNSTCVIIWGLYNSLMLV